MRKILIITILLTNLVFLQDRNCSDMAEEYCLWLDYCEWTDEGCVYIGENDWSCLELEDPNDCYDMGCEWIDNDNMPGGGFCVEGEWEEDECSGLSQDECIPSDECEWSSYITPDGFYEGCIDSEGFGEDDCNSLTQDECEWSNDCEWISDSNNPNSFGSCVEGEWEEDECSGLSQDECISLDECEWLSDSDNPNSFGSCVEGEWEEDECSGLSQDECISLDECEWLSDSDNPNSFGSCIEIGDNDDCNPDLACATVITCYEGLLYPTSCGPENCDESIGECDDYIEGCQSDNGQWYDIGQEMFINYCEYYECTENGWSGPFTIDNDNCSDNIECSDLTQDECILIEQCDWSVYITPDGGFYEGCIDSEGFGEDDCNSLTQDECEWSNDCEWISDSYNPNSWGSCVEIGNNNDGPPECLMDCEGIEDINPSENPYEACDWIVSNLSFDPGFSSCTEDCDEDTMIEIYEIVEVCYECLENINIDCSDVFNDNSNQENCEDLNFPDCTASENCEWVMINNSGAYSCVEMTDENNCADLSLDECVENPDCEPNYDSTGEYEGCLESNNQPNFGFLYGHVSYIYGDVVDFVPYAQLHIESIPSNSDMYFFEVMTDGEGYYQIQLPVGSYIVTAFANDETLTQDVQIAPNTENELNFVLGEGYGPWNPYAYLMLGPAQGSPGQDVAMPLYLSSSEFVGGVQFTIQSGVEDVLTPVAIESIDPCFEANYNTLDDGQIIGIIFSLEGCSYPPDEMLHIADIVFNINDYFTTGNVIELFFNSTIVSDTNGNEIPSYGEGNIILVGILGDINGDFEVNVLDVVIAINFALYVNEPTDSEFWASDINADGMINVLDIVQLVNLILDN